MNQIKTFIRKLLKPQSTQPRQLTSVFDKGFHGDAYFMSYVDSIASCFDTFIETGSNVGTTLAYVAKTYPDLQLFSCEPDATAHAKAQETVGKVTDQATIYNVLSPDFFYQLYADKPELKTKKNLFWLDAHGYGYKWPLDRELQFITSEHDTAIIMIDDSEVPGHEQFRYAIYDNQYCNHQYIKTALSAGKDYTFVYPQYVQHTSEHHPLVGYTIIAFGDLTECLPDNPDYSTMIISL